MSLRDRGARRGRARSTPNTPPPPIRGLEGASKGCDGCGRSHEVFSGAQAWGLSTFRSADGGSFVSHYGSGFDGDVMSVTGVIPEGAKALCDLCVAEMLASGSLTYKENYLDLGDWAGQDVGLEGVWEEVS